MKCFKQGSSVNSIDSIFETLIEFQNKIDDLEEKVDNLNDRVEELQGEIEELQG